MWLVEACIPLLIHYKTLDQLLAFLLVTTYKQSQQAHFL